VFLFNNLPAQVSIINCVDRLKKNLNVFWVGGKMVGFFLISFLIKIPNKNLKTGL